MVILSDNTATNMAIDRLGLDAHQRDPARRGPEADWLYKKVYVPATGPMPADQPQFGLGKTTAREMASIMERLATCQLDRSTTGRRCPATAPSAARFCTCCATSRTATASRAISKPWTPASTDRQSPTRPARSTQVRNDVALIATKAGPVVIAAFTFDNADQRWNGDNEGEKTLAKVAQAIVQRWSPAGLDPEAFPWDNPLTSRRRPASSPPRYTAPAPRNGC